MWSRAGRSRRPQHQHSDDAAGAFVGIAAFFGALMNWNFLMAGAASTNPLLLMLGIVLIRAWKVAGWYGLDRYLLPLLGTPWTWKRQQLPPTRPTPAPTT